MKIKPNDNTILETTGKLSVHLPEHRGHLEFVVLDLLEHTRSGPTKRTESRAFYLHQMTPEMAEIARTIGRLEVVLANYLEQKLEKDYLNLNNKN